MYLAINLVISKISSILVYHIHITKTLIRFGPHLYDYNNKRYIDFFCTIPMNKSLITVKVEMSVFDQYP